MMAQPSNLFLRSCPFLILGQSSEEKGHVLTGPTSIGSRCLEMTPGLSLSATLPRERAEGKTRAAMWASICRLRNELELMHNSRKFSIVNL